MTQLFTGGYQRDDTDIAIGNHHRNFWFDEPSGYLFVAYIQDTGNHRVVREKDGVVQGPWFGAQMDNVNDPHHLNSITVDPGDSRAVVFYDGHNSTCYWRKSTDPLFNPVTTVGTELTFDSDSTYPHPFYIGSRLCVVHRTNDNDDVRCKYTDNGGGDWSDVVLLRQTGKRCYCQEIRKIANRWHAVMSVVDTSQGEEYNRRIAYAYTEDGANWYDCTGTVLSATPATWILPSYTDYTCPRGVGIHPDGDIVILEYHADSAGDPNGNVTARLLKQNYGGSDNWGVWQSWSGYKRALNGPLLISGKTWRIYASRYDGTNAAVDEIASEDNGETFTVSTKIGPFPQTSAMSRFIVQAIRNDDSRIGVVINGVGHLIHTGLPRKPFVENHSQAIWWNI